MSNTFPHRPTLYLTWQEHTDSHLEHGNLEVVYLFLEINKFFRVLSIPNLLYLPGTKCNNVSLATGNLALKYCSCQNI